MKERGEEKGQRSRGRGKDTGRIAGKRDLSAGRVSLASEKGDP